ncbi:MAG TPA: hypothetical protein ENN42_04465 [Thioalkalivibrio sp.]|nr:hypothetical protein [Thioalkalivibrio sp.]
MLQAVVAVDAGDGRRVARVLRTVTAQADHHVLTIACMTMPLPAPALEAIPGSMNLYAFHNRGRRTAWREGHYVKANNLAFHAEI